ncbi:hypothetical protein O3M35_012627 [Rhynocoris fuscipes]|uniref:Uncharacterized protein n=1 Tax=Rhynocoris fuscipes TaxID=488301 RepID=A0AAW1CUA4_9HEMI
MRQNRRADRRRNEYVEAEEVNEVRMAKGRRDNGGQEEVNEERRTKERKDSGGKKRCTARIILACKRLRLPRDVFLEGRTGFGHSSIFSDVQASEARTKLNKRELD